MSVLGTVDAPLDMFGGLVTDVAPADLPAGASPDCADVAFVPGAVKTRPGLLSVFAAISGNPTINYLKTYIQPNLTETLLALDSAGSVWGEFTPGTLTQINTGPGGKFVAPNCRAKSTTLFGREYIAFHDGRFGIDIPRQYDGTNFDRVSQVGPGAGPVTAFDAPAEPVYTIGNSPTGAVRNNNVVTITTTAAHNFYPGASVLIAGVVDTSFNGTFVVQSVPSATTLTYQQLGAAEQLRRKFWKRHGNARAAAFGGLASGVRLFQDAPGLYHAAFAAGDLDRVGQSPRSIDGNSAAAQ